MTDSNGLTPNEKNVVKGDISNVHSVRIGDNIESHHHYHEIKSTLPKELTLTVPRTDPRDIIGREEDLLDLYELLSKEQRVVVVNGLGGIGKSTLAQAYVSQYYEEYKHIVWVSQTSKSILEGFVNDAVLIKNLSIEIVGQETWQIFEDILRKLKSIESRPNLLVIDNGEQSLSSCLAMLPSQPNWHILVTSREVIEGLHPKSLGFLSEDQAIELFKKHYPLQRLSLQDIRELVQVVDYHTLTIEILAKTAKMQRYDAAILKGAIENNLKANVDVPHSKESGKVKRVGTYLSAVFGLSRLSEDETWLLKQFTCLPAEFHTFDLLRELLVGEGSPYKEIFSENLTLLAQKGWLLQDTSTDSYKMHRIVADVLKREQPVKFGEVRNLVSAITRLLSLNYTRYNPVEKFVWIPFGKALLDCVEENEIVEVMILQNNMALVLKILGDNKGAMAMSIKATLSLEKLLGENHPNTAVSYANLGILLRDSGNHEEARNILEKAKSSVEKFFGEDHPDTAKVYSNLAIVLQDFEDYEGAKALLKKAVFLVEKHYGKNHPETAVCSSNLALLLQDLGEYEEAEAILEDVLLFGEKYYGEDHPYTATSYSNLGMLLRELGKYQDAKALLGKALYIYEKHFGPEHPDTARSYSNLGVLLQDLGENEEARIFLERAVSSGEKCLGKYHPKTALYCYQLALLLNIMGDYKSGETFLCQAILYCESVLGQEHPTTLIHYINRALLLIKLGENLKALELSERVLAVYRKNFPEGHPNIIKVQEIYESAKHNLK